MVKLDHFDVAVLAGLASLVAGVWWMSPPWALILGGAFAMAYGLFGSWRKGMGGE